MPYILNYPLFADMVPSFPVPDQTFVKLSGITTLAGAVALLLAVVWLIYCVLSRPKRPKLKEEGESLVASEVSDKIVFADYRASWTILCCVVLLLAFCCSFDAQYWLLDHLHLKRLSWEEEFIISNSWYLIPSIAILFVMWIGYFFFKPKNFEQRKASLVPRRVALKKFLALLALCGVFAFALAQAFDACSEIFAQKPEPPRFDHNLDPWLFDNNK